MKNLSFSEFSIFSNNIILVIRGILFLGRVEKIENEKIDNEKTDNEKIDKWKGRQMKRPKIKYPTTVVLKTEDEGFN